VGRVPAPMVGACVLLGHPIPEAAALCLSRGRFPCRVCFFRAAMAPSFYPSGALPWECLG
jgi:hypothetical protein